jgi:glycosyltransferase involved in cell wall biosynthesis
MDTEAVLIQQLPPTSLQLRVATVTETYPPEVNGVAMTTGRLVDGLLRRGVHLQLIRPRQGAADQASQRAFFEEILARGVPIPRYGDLRMGLPARRALIEHWSSRRPDVVHLVTEGPLGWSALAAARKLRLPIVSEYHTNFHSYSGHYGVGWLRRPIASYLRRFHNKSDVTLVPTHAMQRQLLAQGYKRVSVVSRGVDTELFTPARRSAQLRTQWGLTDQDLALLYVGRLAPEKNIEAVLRAFEAVAAAHAGAKLILVGDGPARPALCTAGDSRHIVTGMRCGEDLATHYASADIFLFASLTETFGNVTVEAMASGLAVVAFDYAAAAELIEDGENGVLCPMPNSDAFVRAALALAGDRQRLGRLRLGARKRVERLAWNHIVSALAAALEGAVRSHERHADAQRAKALSP